MSNPRRALVAASAYISLLLTSPLLCAGDNLRTVALTGMPVPGACPDAVFTTFRNPAAGFGIPPVLNNSGQTAIEARFIGGGQYSRALLSEGEGSGLRIVSNQVPILALSAPGATYPPNVQTISDDGETGFLRSVPDFDNPP